MQSYKNVQVGRLHRNTIDYLKKNKCLLTPKRGEIVTILKQTINRVVFQITFHISSNTTKIHLTLVCCNLITNILRKYAWK